MGPTKDSAQTAVGALSRPPPPLLPRLPWSIPSFRFRQIRGSFLLLPASPAGGPSPASLPLLPAHHRGFQAGASGPGSNPGSPQAHSLTSLTPGCSHLARGQRRFWPDRAAARVPSWVHAMRREQRGRHEPSAHARRLPPPPLLSRVAPALSLRPPHGTPRHPLTCSGRSATPTSACMAGLTPQEPVTASSVWHSGCCRPGGAHSGGGGGCRRKTGKACVGPGATRGHSGGAEVPEAQAVIQEEGWGSPGPHRTPCSVWRGMARRYPQGPAGAPFTRAQGQHHLGSARLSQEKASSWVPPTRAP